MLLSLGLAYVAKYYQQTAMGQGHSTFAKQDGQCPSQFHTHTSADISRTSFLGTGQGIKVGECEEMVGGGSEGGLPNDLLARYQKDFWSEVREQAAAGCVRGKRERVVWGMQKDFDVPLLLFSTSTKQNGSNTTANEGSLPSSRMQVYGDGTSQVIAHDDLIPIAGENGKHYFYANRTGIQFHLRRCIPVRYARCQQQIG
jgi:hypothetical protein